MANTTGTYGGGSSVTSYSTSALATMGSSVIAIVAVVAAIRLASADVRCVVVIVVVGGGVEDDVDDRHDGGGSGWVLTELESEEGRVRGVVSVVFAAIIGWSVEEGWKLLHVPR